MPADRVIVEILTSANMAGVTEAKAGFLGLHASTLALGASLGLVIGAGKSMIEISEKQDAAEKGLTQAITARNAAHVQTVVDTSAVTKATEELHKASRALDEFDVGH